MKFDELWERQDGKCARCSVHLGNIEAVQHWEFLFCRGCDRVVHRGGTEAEQAVIGYEQVTANDIIIQGSPTLNQVLESFKLETLPGSFGVKNIYDTCKECGGNSPSIETALREGTNYCHECGGSGWIMVFKGKAHKVWEWLRETGRIE